MRKSDLSVPALLLEAVTILVGICYVGLQIYYGVVYHVNPLSFVLNIAAVLMVYVVLTILGLYPEWVHRFPAEQFSKKVRQLTLQMLRWVKCLFLCSLLIPCIFDVMGKQMRYPLSAIVVVLIVVIVAGHEVAIFKTIRNEQRK